MVEPVTINLRFLAQDINLPQEQVQAVISLLDEGFPVPFIARYRKDKTGNLDEEQLRLIDSELKAARALCERKQAILKTIDSLGKLTETIDKKVRDARTLKKLEDIYLPFKPKKQTLATVARQRGLEPLALEIIEGKLNSDNLDSRASEFINEDKKLLSIADVLLGAGHIIAEMFGEKAEVLQRVREIIHRNGKISTKKIASQSPDAQAGEIVADDKAEKETVPAQTSDQPESQAEVQENTINETETQPEPDVSAETDQTVENAVPAENGEPAENLSASDSTAPDSTAPESAAPDSSDEQSPEPEAVAAETDSTNEAVDTQSEQEKSDAQELTEQFQQWKEAQEEQGLPSVTSQNTLRKRKREEIKRKKAEIKHKQREQLERQFSDYFDFTSGIKNMPAHRILAMNRGEKHKVLRIKIETDESRIFDSVRDICVPKEHPLHEFLAGCLRDGLKRLVLPSIEREIRAEMTDFAERSSIQVFAKNLRKLLLQPPLHRKRVLALDPGIRFGCKMAPLDEFGNVLGFETIYLTGSGERKEKAALKIADLIKKFSINVIAIGNGTGSREAEECVSAMIAKHFTDSELAYLVVNEAGASVYSASPIAKEEFPDYDVLLRGAISIGRRLQDPLNELVKIEPASLGVGMYQHDVKGKLLRETLTEVVQSCVNYVGVDLNTATPAILRYVAGLNQLTAKRIYDYRKEHGPFRTREELKQVQGLGEISFTHAAGFLKILGGSNALDATWIHPESYEAASKILQQLGFSIDDLRQKEKVESIATKIREEKSSELAAKFSQELNVGIHTVKDILDNLARPGRDPRESLPEPIFKKGVLHMEDLSPGMELTGTVLNVVDFGAFVDVGLHDSGMVHISQMADRYIQDAHDKVAVGDIVRVWVVEADPKRKRISLSMLPPGTEKQPRHEHRRRAPQQEGEQNASERPRRPERKTDAPRREHGPKREENKSREGAPRNEQRGDRNRGPRRDRRDNEDRRERGPKTFVSNKSKEVKPITEEMKKGKEPLRSFGDLAQLLGRVQVPDPAEEKKRKKEEDKRKKNNAAAKEDAGKSPELNPEPAPVKDSTPEQTIPAAVNNEVNEMHPENTIPEQSP